MVAWFIRAGTSLFGQTVFGVRFFAVLLASGTGLGLYCLGKELFSPRIGFWAVVIASVIPLFAVGASLMTIDTVYIFFWTWAAWAFWHAKNETRLRWWVLTGVLVGLGLLSKYTAALELFSFAAFCLWYRPSRIHFRCPTFWIMTGVALVLSHSSTCLEYQARLADDSLAVAAWRLERAFFLSSFRCSFLSRRTSRRRLATSLPWSGLHPLSSLIDANRATRHRVHGDTLFAAHWSLSPAQSPLSRAAQLAGRGLHRRRHSAGSKGGRAGLRSTLGEMGCGGRDWTRNNRDRFAPGDALVASSS